LAHVAADVPLTNAEYARKEELEAGILTHHSKKHRKIFKISL